MRRPRRGRYQATRISARRPAPSHSRASVPSLALLCSVRRVWAGGSPRHSRRSRSAGCPRPDGHSDRCGRGPRGLDDDRTGVLSLRHPAGRDGRAAVPLDVSPVVPCPRRRMPSSTRTRASPSSTAPRRPRTSSRGPWSWVSRACRHGPPGSLRVVRFATAAEEAASTVIGVEWSSPIRWPRTRRAGHPGPPARPQGSPVPPGGGSGGRSRACPPGRSPSVRACPATGQRRRGHRGIGMPQRDHTSCCWPGTRPVPEPLRLLSRANLAGTKAAPGSPGAARGPRGGLVALSGCRESELARRLRAGDRAGARAVAREYARRFGGPGEDMAGPAS